MELEVCVDSVNSALNARDGGAKRLELCSSLCLGGLTPSLGLFKTVKKLVSPDCLIFVMIRPKPKEEYVYDENDLKVMVEDVRVFKEHGADGFVFGCLDEDKNVDEKACRRLLSAAENLPCTFHRAFDVVRNPEKALFAIVEMGFSRLLTSGREKNAYLGRNAIRDLRLRAKNQNPHFIIVAGGGVDVDNLEEILDVTGVKEYHGSARAKSSLNAEDPIWATDESTVREMIKRAKNYYERRSE